MAYWLLKSEPDIYSYDDLARLGEDHWNGVRNYQARNYLRQMQVDDLCFFYHSSTQPAGIVGVMRVTQAAYADPSQFDARSEFYDPKSLPNSPRWSTVNVQSVQPLPRLLTLDTLRQLPEWQASLLVRRGNRLSVLSVTAEQFGSVLQEAGIKLHD